MANENEGFKFWQTTLKGARLVAAPMVDASELAWRILCRRYGAELCYTPMLHSSVFARDSRYRKESLTSCPEDRPLIVQFCSNDPDTLVTACRLAASFCDAVDLNLGCPQSIAKRGHYGAFLMDEWDLIAKMISRVASEVPVPITAKIRVFPDVSKTIRYAQMLEKAGVSLLTVHGRVRDQRGPATGLADWSQIKAVRESINIPIIANGNIQYLSDVDRCLEETGAQGVMSAEGILYNPAIFRGIAPVVWEIALEYLELAEMYPCPLSYSRGHIFKLMYHCFVLPENENLRFLMSKAANLAVIKQLTLELKEKYIEYQDGTTIWIPKSDHSSVPPWICQPYVRIPVEEHNRKMEEGQQRRMDRLIKEEEERTKGGEKRELLEEEKGLSKKKLRKLERNPHKNFNRLSGEEVYKKCACKNPCGGRCTFSLCKKCCRNKCRSERLHCTGHHFKPQPKKIEPFNENLDENELKTVSAPQNDSCNEKNVDKSDIFNGNLDTNRLNTLAATPDVKNVVYDENMDTDGLKTILAAPECEEAEINEHISKLVVQKALQETSSEKLLEFL